MGAAEAERNVKERRREFKRGVKTGVKGSY